MCDFHNAPFSQLCCKQFCSLETTKNTVAKPSFSEKRFMSHLGQKLIGTTTKYCFINEVTYYLKYSTSDVANNTEKYTIYNLSLNAFNLN